jgi:predicted signal transduction protein with EAL and GGDEF domain
MIALLSNSGNPNAERNIVSIEEAARAKGVELLVLKGAPPYLTSYPVTRLKIAQSLVTPMIDDPRHLAVVQAAIQLGRALGIEVLAEGVETEAHARFLASVGCEQAQGYYYSCPVNAECATELLRVAFAPTKIAAPEVAGVIYAE